MRRTARPLLGDGKCQKVRSGLDSANPPALEWLVDGTQPTHGGLREQKGRQPAAGAVSTKTNLVMTGARSSALASLYGQDDSCTPCSIASRRPTRATGRCHCSSCCSPS